MVEKVVSYCSTEYGRALFLQRNTNQKVPASFLADSHELFVAEVIGRLERPATSLVTRLA